MSKAYRNTTVFLQAVMALALVLSAWRGNWSNTFFIAGVMLMAAVPFLVQKRFDIYIPPEFELTVIVFVFAAMFLGEFRDYYERFWWWDDVLHTASGVIIGIFGFLLVYILNQADVVDVHLSPVFVALFALSFAIALGAVWEIFEFAMDNLFGLNMQKSGLVDTMWDLIVDSLGALLATLLGYQYMKRGQDSFVGRGIEKFVGGNPDLVGK